MLDHTTSTDEPTDSIAGVQARSPLYCPCCDHPIPMHPPRILSPRTRSTCTSSPLGPYITSAPLPSNLPLYQTPLSSCPSPRLSASLRTASSSSRYAATRATRSSCGSGARGSSSSAKTRARRATLLVGGREGEGGVCLWEGGGRHMPGERHCFMEGGMGRRGGGDGGGHPCQARATSPPGCRHMPSPPLPTSDTPTHASHEDSSPLPLLLPLGQSFLRACAGSQSR